MTKNMGTIDKVIRILIAGIIGLLHCSGKIPSPWGGILLIVAAVFVLTSIFGFCPLYKLFGINTCRIKRK